MAINMQEADAIIDRIANAIGMMDVPSGPPLDVVERAMQARPSIAGDVGSGHQVQWRVAFISAAAMVLLAFGIFELANRGGQAHGGMIFADVIAELKQVHTVTYRNVVTHPGPRGVPVTYVERNIVDMAGSFSRTEMLDAPAKDASGEKPAETVRGISIYNRGKMLNLDPETKRATLRDYNTDGLPHTLADEHTLSDLIKLNPLEAVALGDRVFDGVKLTGFRVQRGHDSFQTSTVDVWVDPRTHLPARIEETTTRREADAKAIAAMNANGGVIHMTPEEADKVMATWPKVTTTSIITDIVFNVAVSEETFSVATPPGYSLTVMNVPG